MHLAEEMQEQWQPDLHGKARRRIALYQIYEYLIDKGLIELTEQLKLYFLSFSWWLVGVVLEY